MHISIEDAAMIGKIAVLFH